MGGRGACGEFRMLRTEDSARFWAAVGKVVALLLASPPPFGIRREVSTRKIREDTRGEMVGELSSTLGRRGLGAAHGARGVALEVSYGDWIVHRPGASPPNRPRGLFQFCFPLDAHTCSEHAHHSPGRFEVGLPMPFGSWAFFVVSCIGETITQPNPLTSACVPRGTNCERVTQFPAPGSPHYHAHVHLRFDPYAPTLESLRRAGVAKRPPNPKPKADPEVPLALYPSVLLLPDWLFRCFGQFCSGTVPEGLVPWPPPVVAALCNYFPFSCRKVVRRTAYSHETRKPRDPRTTLPCSRRAPQSPAPPLVPQCV